MVTWVTEYAAEWSRPFVSPMVTSEFADLLGFPVVGLTAPALLGIAILLILTGRLVPKSTYDSKATEAEKWQQAHAISEEARLAQTRQMDAVLEVGDTVKNVLLALERVRQDKEPP